MFHLIYSLPYRKFHLWSDDTTERNTDPDTLPLLHVASGEGNLDLIETLLDCGVNVNEIDRNGLPAIHYAVSAGNFECAQKLISHGADLETYSNKVVNKYCTEIRKTIQYC